MTTVDEDRTQARIDGLLQVLRAAEADFRWSYARVLEVVAELDAERAGAISGFGTTARLLGGVLNLSKGEAALPLIVQHRAVLGSAGDGRVSAATSRSPLPSRPRRSPARPGPRSPTATCRSRSTPERWSAPDCPRAQLP